MALAACFSAEPEAYLAQGMLDANGITAYVEANSMATLYGAGSTWAPIKLFVPAADLTRAMDLLKEHGDI